MLSDEGQKKRRRSFRHMYDTDEQRGHDKMTINLGWTGKVFNGPSIRGCSAADTINTTYDVNFGNQKLNRMVTQCYDGIDRYTSSRFTKDKKKITSIFTPGKDGKTGIVDTYYKFDSNKEPRKITTPVNIQKNNGTWTLKQIPQPKK